MYFPTQKEITWKEAKLSRLLSVKEEGKHCVCLVPSNNVPVSV